jgi:hypothetical protein
MAPKAVSRIFRESYLPIIEQMRPDGRLTLRALLLAEEKENT